MGGVSGVFLIMAILEISLWYGKYFLTVGSLLNAVI